MKTSFFAGFLSVLLLCCSAAERRARPLHDTENGVRLPYVDIAVNLGLKHEEDLHRLYDAIALKGLRCGMRAMSLNAEQIVVERGDFDRVKIIVTGIVVRDKLTVRIYKSADLAEPASAPTLEVWENGKKVREEQYKLYLD